FSAPPCTTRYLAARGRPRTHAPRRCWARRGRRPRRSASICCWSRPARTRARLQGCARLRSRRWRAAAARAPPPFSRAPGGAGADELEPKLEAYAAAKLAYDPRGVDEYDRRRDYLLSLADRVGGEAGGTLALLLASISTSRGERLADSAALAAQVLDGGGHIARVGGEHWSLPQGIVALVFNEEI